jgi:hypothetical protein
MKQKLSIILCVLAAAILSCPSCKKDRPINARTSSSTPSPSVPPASLSTNTSRIDSSLIGKEFIFSSTWFIWTDAMGDMIYVSIDPRDSFSMASLSSLASRISLQMDAASTWIEVPFWNWYQNYNPFTSATGYSWYFAHWPYYDNSNFLIENFPFNYQLIGKTVNIKVRFL